MNEIALYLLIIISILIFLVVVIVIHSFRNKKKYIAILEKQKSEIEKLNEKSKLSIQKLIVQRNKIEKNKETLQLIIKNSNDIFVLVNDKGEQYFISEAAKRLTGYTVKELMGKIKNVIYPDDLDIVQQHWERVLANKSKADTIQYRHKHKEKGYIWMETIAQNFLDDPVINAVVANVRDINEKKILEAKLIESNKEKEKLLSLEFDRVNNELEMNQKIMMLASLKLIQNSERDMVIIEKLKEIKLNKKFKNINSLISYFKHSSSVSNLNEFEMLFKSIHFNFYKILNNKFPDLTANERKICAFLKLNMSSKDISKITFQSDAALKKARLRLRKKLGIGRETNLTVFLQNI